VCDLTIQSLTDTNEAGEEVDQEIPFLMEYTVFNVEQVAGLPDRFYQT
jgi:antirestriction protein ArdC